MSQVKICSKCGEVKPLWFFHKLFRSKDGRRPECKECHLKQRRDYRINNRQRVLTLKKAWRVSKSGATSVALSKRRAKESGKTKAQSRNYYKRNSQKIIKAARHRFHTNINTRIAENLRRRMHKMIKRGKPGSTTKCLGCTWHELKEYLESKFLPGMVWENYGSGAGKWNIDHIKPLSKVDLTDITQFAEVCHYSNLQPMWSEENSSKGNR